MNKNDLRIVKTKINIHQALLNILKNKTLAQIKVTELCKEASINRGTFYFHYEEIGDVFKELFEKIMLDLQDSYNEPYRHITVLNVEKLDPKTVGIFQHVKKYEQFYRIVLSREVSTTYYYMLFDEIRSNFISDKNTQVHGKVNDYFYSYTANAFIGLIIEWHRRDFKESVEEMNVQLLNIVNLKV
ncbi:MAG: TetR/AcrR family transcriptional regulator [Candidatus Pristimantibacillus lignocellulolyticus]|uniref:TetR/AcrR family transcriptional regulator n=1 Tax=Candidatus Pristimantibacillus lignocellulolyticus TaxID=2994561 RepID=A0A9J6ZJM3_9BACL|nr:MAG: TetR/AcrR family transcriptional regulator [Candidatus Pristimantibacillus lignocellulolyticus]